LPIVQALAPFSPGGCRAVIELVSRASLIGSIRLYDTMLCTPSANQYTRFFGFVKLAGIAGSERHVAGIWDSRRCRITLLTNRYGGVKDAFFLWLAHQLCMQCVFQEPLLSAAGVERDGSCRILYFFPGLWYNKSISPRFSEKE
jgi:hypothetical protein